MVNNPQNQTFWQKAKEFAGSNLGRNLIGGLGSGLAVALSGGDGRDALRYGLQGAAATTNAINRRNLYNDRMVRDELERADRLAEAERSRQFQMDMMNNQINANKDLADINFRNALAEIDYNNMAQANAEEAERQRKIQNIQNNPYLSEQQKSWQIANIDGGFDNDSYFQNILLNPSSSEESRNSALDYFGRKQALDKILNPPEPVPFKDFAQGMNYLKQSGADNNTLQNVANNYGYDFTPAINAKDYATGELGLLQFYMDQGKSLDEARLIVGNMTPEEKRRQEIYIYAIKAAIDAGKDTYVHNINAGTDFAYNERGKDNQLERDMTLKQFETTLPTEARREAEEAARAMGIPVSEIYAEMRAKRQAEIREAAARILKIMKETDQLGKPGFNELQTGVNNGTISADVANQQFGQNVFQTPVSEAEKELAKQQVKDKASQEKSAKQVADMMPRVLGAIDRAYTALDDGTGLGQMGGLWWTNKKGGENRANVQNAQAQINTLMRGILSTMGVGATEMNSAAEAAAYRYMIDPAMPESQIRQVLDNFKQDYASGALMQDLQSIANTYGNYTIERVE